MVNKTAMIQRKLINILREDLKSVPAIVLFGPRQVGKTTLVKQIALRNKKRYIYLDMETPSDHIKLRDPELFLSRLNNNTVVIDEVQVMPDLFPVLRALIDQRRKAGRFILLGSASPELLQRSAESLAGRVRYRELFPFSLEEVGIKQLDSLWFRGGFPKAFLTSDNKQAMAWLTDFIYSYASRDLRMLGLSMRETQIIRLLQMLAHQHGQLLNYSNLSRSLGVSVPTITNALYYLEEAMLVRTLKPWHFNAGKRLVKTPKVYIRDSGMLHQLLFLENYEQLMGHPQAGNSWEGFAIQQILMKLPGNIHSWFYRSQAGSEIDLLLTKGNTLQCAVEIKLTNTPEITRGHTEAVNDLKPKHQILLTPGADTYPVKGKWMVYSLANFIKEMNTLF